MFLSLTVRFQTSLKHFEKSLLASPFMSVRPSIRPHGATRLQGYGFYVISYLIILQKSVKKIQVSLQSDKNNGYL